MKFDGRHLEGPHHAERQARLPQGRQSWRKCIVRGVYAIIRGMRQEQIPYGVKDFKRIRLKNRYYVDKTAYIRQLEKRADSLFFVRPRRFGKTLLCETLKCYYDVAEKENFQKLFGDLAIGRDPTDQANRYFVLMLDFSRVGICLAVAQLKKYAADPNLAALAGGTPVHFICYEFKGRELIRLEEIERR